jgi:eukaryotic-like serine/threonine-protein kinase
MKRRGEQDRSTGPVMEPSLSRSTIGEPLVSARRGRAAAHPRGSPLPAFPIRKRERQRYEFLGEHGRGGLGLVSRAHDQELGRDVAIKELLSHDSVDEARFLREALITARLEHPGIVPVHEAGRWPDGTPFYAMKLVAGRPLCDLIAELDTVEQRVGLLHHVIAVADAIAYAHGRHIIHRDLKPANVIVGDFGETIVIDWGLAKDLTSSEEPAIGSGRIPIGLAGDVTIAGSVLGTPAYMAPEQKRGESLDQRADVYAIGVMLWELCAIRRVPPARVHLRHRRLRDAGIDDDLATIIVKALDPDPDRRYPDAGALAADLKAFKSGVRIAARSYSLFAMLAHWTRRHRRYAISAVAAITVALIGSLVFVRNIAAERDRADASGELARRARVSAEASEEVAKRARVSAEAALDQLTLHDAQLLLATDPSAAIDALASYHGADRGRADQIRAEATARGVAVLRALPHTAAVFWAAAASDGAVVSLSADGTIARTTPDGTSSVLVRGVSKVALSAYAPSRHLLAYTCDPSDVCLFDVTRGARLSIAAALHDLHVTSMAFSPDEAWFAVTSQDTVLRIFDLTDPTRPVLRVVRPIAGSIAVKFADDRLAAVATAAGVEFVGVAGDSQRFPVVGFADWASSARDHRFMLVTDAGDAILLEGTPLHVATRAQVCRGPVSGVQFIPGRSEIAYACRTGTIGLWDPRRNVATPRAQVEGHADLLFVSPAGDNLVATGGNGIVTVIDLETDLVASYKGHGFRLTAVTPAADERAFLISADVRGALRVWPRPARLTRVVATSGSAFLAAIFDVRSTRAVATTWGPRLTTFSPPTGVRTFGPHEGNNVFLEQAGDGRTFATYGFTELVELWSSETMTRTKVIATGHGSVSQLSFAGNDLITSGHDGRVIRWTASGDKTLLAQSERPIDRFAAVSPAGAIVFATTDGALWRAAPGSPAVSLRAAGARVNQIVAVADQHEVLAGYANGDVVAIDTTSWQQETLLQGTAAVQEIAVANDAGTITIAVATNGGTIHLGTWRDASLHAGAATWMTLAASARRITLRPGGLLIATCSDGTIWLYSIPRKRWLCLPTGTVDLGQTAVAGDGKVMIAPDREGRLLWIDLGAAGLLLAAPHPPT